MTKYLTNKKLPFNLSFRAFNYLEGEKIEDDATFWPTVAWCGFRGGHERERKSFDLTLEDVIDLIDDDMTLMVEIAKEYAEAIQIYRDAKKKILEIHQKATSESGSKKPKN